MMNRMSKVSWITGLCALLLLVATASHAQKIVEKGNVVMEDIPDIPSEIQMRLQQYQNTRSASLSDWHPEGKGILIRTRFGETTQIHHVEKPGGTRKQITFFNEPTGSASSESTADLNGFLFGKDAGGSEYYQVFYFDLSTGRHQMLTDGTSRNGGQLWASKGDKFVYYTTRRNQRDWDLHVIDMLDPERKSTPILEAGGVWFASDWSPDDQKQIVTRYISANETHPHILDLGTGKLKRLFPEGKVSYSGGIFSADGKGIFFSSDENSEFHRLRYLDLKSGDQKVLTADINWDIQSMELSPNGKHLAFTSNEDGIGVLHLREVETWKAVPLPDLPTGQVSGINFKPDGSELAFTLNTPQTSGDVYSIRLADDKLVRWTYSETGGLDAQNFISPTLVRYPTFDQVDGKPRMIPSFYYKPKGDGPFPVLISIHGGPEGQARPFFSSTTQYYLNELGIAVLVPNVRGSSGYGKSYLQMDNGYKREDSVKDIGALLDWVGDQAELDADRIAVIGGSYGGYMVLASMVHYNDRLRAGIDIVGISNFVTFLKNTKEYRRDLRRPEYGDERDPEMNAFLEKISPNNHASKISKPLFIAQGLNDPRVPASESEQMVKEIRSSGGDVWYFLAKDEGHGFRKKSNRDLYTSAVMLFLETYLLPKGGS